MRQLIESGEQSRSATIILKLLFALFVGASLLMQPHPASSATLTVTSTNDSGSGTLRQVILNAASGDTINFGVTGTIQLASELIITKDLTILGPGASNLTVSGGGLHRIFTLETPGAVISISGLTIANGFYHDPSNFHGGGGITTFNVTVTLNDVALTGHSSNMGGAILVGNGSTVNISNSLINANGVSSGIAAGGGIYICSGGALNLSNSTISNNTAGNGGGGGIRIMNDASATITGSSIYGNTATLSGAGAGIMTQGILSLTNSTISGNSAYNGGGLSALDNTTSVTLLNSTIAHNSVSLPGTANLDIYGIGAVVTSTNTIVAAPTTAGAANCRVAGGAVMVSHGHNLDSENSCGFNGSGDLINTDPMLAALGAGTPGNTQVHGLFAGSPAIDAADGAACPATDQRGMLRPQGGGCDIGAYERDVYRAIHTSVSGGNGSISCVPYSFTNGTTDIIYNVLDWDDPVCVMTPSINYHVSDILVGPYGAQPVSVGPVWAYGFPSIREDKTVQASFAANHIWLFKNGLPVQTVTTTINAALTQAATADDDEIRIESGAYLEGFGLTCSGDFGGVIPKLSGGWFNAYAADARPTVIAPKLTVTGNCALIIDDITIQ